MKQQPIVSVIVPVYNVEQYLTRCVESLLAQTLKEIEIILVDDGSTDKSGMLCDAFAKKDGRVRVIHKENAGQGLARNDGLDIAAGKYVAFLDSDDYMDTDAYRQIADRLEETKADVCCFGYVKHDVDGSVIFRSGLEEEIYEGEKIRRQFVLHFFGDEPGDDRLSGVSSCMSVFKRSVIEKEKIRFLSEREVFSEDSIFNLDFCKTIDRAAVMEKEFYHYCLKADSFTKKYQENRYELTWHFCTILQDYAKQYDLEGETQTRIRMVFWVTLMDCMKQEAQRCSEKGVRFVYRQLRELCERKETRETVAHLRGKKLGAKQNLFLFCMQKKLVLLVLLMSCLRVNRGL